HGLSERDVEILLRIAQGSTDQEIAAALMLAPQTVTRHVSSLFTKIGVNSRAAAAAYASEKGFAPQVQPHGPTETPSALASDAGETQLHQILLVTDMDGSTAIIQRLGDVQAHELLRHHNAIIRDCLSKHRGIEILHTGDGIEAAFLAAS